METDFPFAYMHDEYCQGLINEREEQRRLGYDTSVISALIQARIAQLNGIPNDGYEEPTDDNLFDGYCEDL